MNLFNLTIGDASRDGHEKTESFILRTNVTQVQLADIYQRLVNVYNIDFNNICKNYEDNKPPTALLQVAKQIGYSVKNFYSMDEWPED